MQFIDIKPDDVSIFIVTEENDIVCVDEFDPKDSSGAFIMITNELLNNECSDNNTIYLHRDTIQIVSDITFYHALSQSKGIMWQRGHLPHPINPNHLTTTNPLYSIKIFANDIKKYAYKDFNGYRNTVDILNEAERVKPMVFETLESFVPAVYYALHISIPFCGKQIHGFLPSVGQMDVIRNYVSEINYVFQQLFHTRVLNTWLDNELKIRIDEDFWTSNEFDKDYVYTLTKFGIHKSLKENNQFQVLPLFKLQ